MDSKSIESYKRKRENGPVFNFVLNTANAVQVPNNTVGLFISSLINESQAFTANIYFNGCHYLQLSQSKAPLEYSPHPLSKFLPRRFVEYVRDQKLSKSQEIPVSWFMSEATNIVFLAHNIQLPKFQGTEKPENLVGLLDEPPSLGDNFKTSYFFKKVRSRFSKELSEYTKFWVYHEGTRNYLSELGIDKPVYTFPCVIDYQPWLASDRQSLSTPIRIAMASSFLPWHGITAMIKVLQVLLRQGTIHLTLIGDGPSKQQAIEASLDLPNVEFLPSLPFKEYQILLQNFDFGILWDIPWFNSPLKLMDYARAGLTIITKESIGVTSIWPRESYMTIREFISLADDQETLANLSTKRRHRMEEHFRNRWSVEYLQKHLISLSS